MNGLKDEDKTLECDAVKEEPFKRFGEGHDMIQMMGKDYLRSCVLVLSWEAMCVFERPESRKLQRSRW